MINSAEEFIHLREENDPRATYDEASTKTWGDIINRYPEMKSWVIHNKTVPISILRLMISDPDPSIRADIATKRKLNEDMFIKLAFDDNENVRRRLLYNKKTPVHVLKVLTDDPNKDISEYAAKRIAEL